MELLAAPPLLFTGRGREFGEEHGARGGLVKTDEFDFDFLTELFAGVVDNDHRTIAQISNALMGIAAGGNDLDFGTLTGEVLIAQGESEGVKI